MVGRGAGTGAHRSSCSRREHGSAAREFGKRRRTPAAGGTRPPTLCVARPMLSLAASPHAHKRFYQMSSVTSLATLLGAISAPGLALALVSASAPLSPIRRAAGARRRTSRRHRSSTAVAIASSAGITDGAWSSASERCVRYFAQVAVRRRRGVWLIRCSLRTARTTGAERKDVQPARVVQRSKLASCAVLETIRLVPSLQLHGL